MKIGNLVEQAQAELKAEKVRKGVDLLKGRIKELDSLKAAIAVAESQLEDLVDKDLDDVF
jgi:uncharacterized protein YhaN